MAATYWLSFRIADDATDEGIVAILVCSIIGAYQDPDIFDLMPFTKKA